MSRGSHRFMGAVLGSALALSLGAGPAAHAQEPRSVLAGRPGPVIASTLFGLNAAYPALAAQSVPASYVRLWDAGVSWAAVEPAHGKYSWARLDGLIAQAEASGLQVMYVLGDTPRWAADHRTRPPRNIDDLRHYVRALLDRYGPRIAAIQAWNEANLITYFSGSPQDVADMTKAVHDVVHAKHMPTRVIAASMTARSNGAYATYVRDEYLTALAQRGWPVDAFAVHSYPRASGTPADRVTGVRAYQQLLIKHRAPRKPLLETEINYGLAGLGEGRRALDGSLAQAYLAQTYVDTVRLGMTSAFWYRWTPKPYPLLGIQLDPSSSESLAAWQWAHENLVGARLIACDVQGAVVSCGFERAGARYVIAYISGEGSASYAVPEGLSRSCQLGRECVPVEGASVTVTAVPTRFDAGVVPTQ